MDTTQQKSLYDRDYYLWLDTTVKQLKNRSFANIDLANLIIDI